MSLNILCIFQDMQHKIRETFRGIPDEFMTSNLASRAKVSDFIISKLLYLLI